MKETDTTIRGSGQYGISGLFNAAAPAGTLPENPPDAVAPEDDFGDGGEDFGDDDGTFREVHEPEDELPEDCRVDVELNLKDDGKE